MIIEKFDEYGKRGFYILSRNSNSIDKTIFWVRATGKDSELGVVYVGNATLYLHKKFVGKRIRLKIEVIE